MFLSQSEWDIQQVITDMEHELSEAERCLKLAEEAVRGKERNLETLKGALEVLQERNALPVALPLVVAHSEAISAPVNGYGSLGPTEMVERWAAEHEGNVVVKDVVKVAIQAGSYKHYRSAYNSLLSTVRRREDFEQIGPGRFRAIREESSQAPSSADEVA